MKNQIELRRKAFLFGETVSEDLLYHGDNLDVLRRRVKDESACLARVVGELGGLLLFERVTL